jgi:hypothetical protein
MSNVIGIEVLASEMNVLNLMSRVEKVIPSGAYIRKNTKSFFTLRI